MKNDNFLMVLQQVMEDAVELKFASYAQGIVFFTGNKLGIGFADVG